MSTVSTFSSRRRSRREAVDDTSHNHWSATVALVLQRRWRRIREWYTDSYPTYDTADYEPSWVLARRANLANCRFYQIPEELVLQILGNLDCVSKAIALRTCGLFIRIMFDRALSSQPLGHRYRTDIRVWPRFEQLALSIPPEARREMSKQVDRLLDRDRFCDPCRQFREYGRYENVMQALQGTLWCSYCDKVHKRLLFSAHQRAASSATRICVLAEGKAQFCGHLTIGWDSTQCAVFRSEQPCRHPDHDPAWYTCWKDSFAGYRSPGYERPHLEFIGGPVSTVTFFLVRLDRGVPITRAWLQEQLTAKAHLLDKMLCPHVTAHDGQLLLPFGPDRCACFDSPRWIDHRCSLNNSTWCCRCNAARNPGRAGYFIPGESNFLLNWQHNYQCFICSATYGWRRTGSAVYLEIATLTGTGKVTLPAVSFPSIRRAYWLYKLHPESWGILNDEELHHVAWCDDINCSSRWRWERLSRLLKDDA